MQQKAGIRCYVFGKYLKSLGWNKKASASMGIAVTPRGWHSWKASWPRASGLIYSDGRLQHLQGYGSRCSQAQASRWAQPRVPAWRTLSPHTSFLHAVLGGWKHGSEADFLHLASAGTCLPSRKHTLLEAWSVRAQGWAPRGAAQSRLWSQLGGSAESLLSAG